MTAPTINDPRLARERDKRELEDLRAKMEADQRAGMEEARAFALRDRAMVLAVQAWPNAMERGAGSLAGLADEIHGFLTGSVAPGDVAHVHAGDAAPGAVVGSGDGSGRDVGSRLDEWPAVPAVAIPEVAVGGAPGQKQGETNQ